MKLSELLSGEAGAIEDIDITGLALDSREVVGGYVFIALAGAVQHGLHFASQAIGQGAVALIYDPAGQGDILACQYNVPKVAVENLGLKLGEIAGRFYGDPSRQIDVIGITGTNGKTSCSHFLSQTLDDCAIIGTLGWGERGQLQKTINTTPDALSVQRMVFELVKSAKKAVAMEVSSHALQQGRVNGLRFKGVVFTNISRDHLDYHGTMEAYIEAKLMLLDKPGITFAVVNLDDPNCGQILARIPASVVSWGISAMGKTKAGIECIHAEGIVRRADGISFTAVWRGQAQVVCVPLYGDFNVENVLTTLAVTLAMGKTMLEAAKSLQSLQAVAGRMEPLGGGLSPLVFVDYAHTPDALDKVLSSVRKHSRADLWVVFGCGGNRDVGKRPQMGQIAAQWADRVIVTDDNPRFEDSQAIVDDIVSDCRLDKIQVIQNRKEAISYAVANAKAGDCIVVAGKGHEDYQEIAAVRLPFNDKQIVMDALNKRVAKQ